MGNGSPDRPAYCFGHSIGIASPSTRQRLDSFQHGIVGGLVQKTAIAVAFRNTNKIKRRILDQLSLVGNGNRHRNGAGKAQPPAIGDGARIGADVELLAGARVWPSVELADGAVRFSSDL